MTPQSLPPALLGLAGPGAAIPLVGGRTNRLWRIGARVLKLYTIGAGTPLFPNDPAAEWAALTALEGTGLAPNPISRHDTAEGPCLIYEHHPGTPGAASPEAVAGLLYRLHTTPPFAGLEPAPTGQAIVLQSQKMVSTPGHQPPAPSKPPRLVPIHRDPIPTNILASQGGNPILIDWQCPGLGDPLEDIAHHLSPAMHHLYGSAENLPARSRRFLEAYPCRETVARYRTDGPAFHHRVAAYCHWQAARGNHDYAAAGALETALIANWPTAP